MYFAYTHAPIPCHFSHNSRDFVVQELPLYECSGNGEHYMLLVRKKNLTTFDMISIIAKAFSLAKNDIGYAGLKDKNATTTQYITIPKHKALNLEERFSHIAKDYDIKLLNINTHANKLKLGHLRGNRFFVRLKKLAVPQAKLLESRLFHIAQNGFPNYFGFQRFGLQGDNYLLGHALCASKAVPKSAHNAPQSLTQLFTQSLEQSPIQSFVRLLQEYGAFAQTRKPKHINATMHHLFISSYQSFLFNAWLQARVLLSAWCEEFSLKELRDLYGYYEHVLHQASHALDSSVDSKLESILESRLDSGVKNQVIAAITAHIVRFCDMSELQEILCEPQFFKLLAGDVCCHYPHGKFFTLESCDESQTSRFSAQNFAPTGALYGKNTKSPTLLASKFEDAFTSSINAMGSRRYAWVWASDVECVYKPEVAQAELHFSLPSGAYATSFLEQVLKQRLGYA